MMNEKKLKFGFGIGCFIFSSRNKDTDPEEFVKKLTHCLNSQTNISNIKIAIDTRIIRKPNQDSITFGNPVQCYPLFAQGSIEFLLYWPSKNQKDLTTLFEGYPYEHFSVQIQYNTQGLPVAFVWFSSSADNFHPSTGVMLVRKYLEKTFEDNKDIHFEGLGPSPAHFDLYLYTDESQQETISYSYKEELEGYDSANVIFNPQRISFEKTKERMFQQMTRNFGLFYFSTARRNYVFRDRNKFIHSYKMLLSLSEKIKWHSLYGKIIGVPAQIKETFLALILVELNYAQLMSELKNTKNDIEEFQKFKKTVIAKEYILKALTEDDLGVNHKVYFDALLFLEERYKNSSQLFIAFISAVIGGVVGSLITILIK